MNRQPKSEKPCGHNNLRFFVVKMSPPEAWDGGWGVLRSKSDTHHHATMAAAFFKSTDTSCDTPCSPMVTPNNRSIRLIVTAW